VFLSVASSRYERALADVGSRFVAEAPVGEEGAAVDEGAEVWSAPLSSLLPETREARWFYHPPFGVSDVDSECPWIVIDEATDVERLGVSVCRAVTDHGVPTLDRLGTLDAILALYAADFVGAGAGERLTDGVDDDPYCARAVLAAECGDRELAAAIFRMARVRARRTPIESRALQWHLSCQEWLLDRGADVADVRVDLHADGRTGAPQLLDRIRARRRDR
jgi:hypothetical protein